MRRSNLVATIAMSFTIAAMAIPSLNAHGQETIFINLSHRTVYVARQTYSSGASSLSVGDYNLPSSSPAGWLFSGWKAIEPGRALRVNPGAYYLMEGSRDVTYSNLRASHGFVLDGSRPFKGFLDASRQSEDARRLRQQGYRAVKYLHFDAKVYYINGSRSYRMKTYPFPFNHESRAFDFINETFRVPGTPVHYEVDARENRWTKSISWRLNDRGVLLSGSLAGRQVRPFGPREPAKYKGTVTVHYTVRN